MDSSASLATGLSSKGTLPGWHGAAWSSQSGSVSWFEDGKDGAVRCSRSPRAIHLSIVAPAVCCRLSAPHCPAPRLADADRSTAQTRRMAESGVSCEAAWDTPLDKSAPPASTPQGHAHAQGPAPAVARGLAVLCPWAGALEGLLVHYPAELTRTSGQRGAAESATAQRTAR